MRFFVFILFGFFVLGCNKEDNCHERTFFENTNEVFENCCTEGGYKKCDITISNSLGKVNLSRIDEYRFDTTFHLNLNDKVVRAELFYCNLCYEMINYGYQMKDSLGNLLPAVKYEQFNGDEVLYFEKPELSLDGDNLEWIGTIEKGYLQIVPKLEEGYIYYFYDEKVSNTPNNILKINVDGELMYHDSLQVRNKVKMNIPLVFQELAFSIKYSNRDTFRNYYIWNYEQLQYLESCQQKFSDYPFMDFMKEEVVD